MTVAIRSRRSRAVRTQCSRTGGDRGSRFHAVPETVSPPGGHERRVFVGAVFPHEVAGVDHAEVAVWQAVAEILRVDERHNCICATCDDLHGSLYLRQEVPQRFKLCWIRLHVAYRFRESIALERGQVVLASSVADHVALERLDHAIDDHTSPKSSI